MSEAQYLMYGYDATLVAAGEGSTFTATAEGDLDGDESTSTFTLGGKVLNQQVNVSQTIYEALPEE